jgi:predicted  nucleic acid-binding Zn-ribbon protein
LKEQLKLLVELQNAEADVLSLKNKKIELPRTKDFLMSEMKGQEEQFETKKEELEKLRQEHKHQEAHLTMSAEKIKKAKGRLIEVKTNKEYEATLKEIETIKESSSKIEDEIIRILDKMEQLTEIVAAEDKQVAAGKCEYENQAAQIEKDLCNIDARLEEKIRMQDSIRKKIDSTLLKKFDLIKTRRNGYAVVAAWNEVCSGCHMNIPPQMYNDLRKSDALILCPHCSRILYWEDRQIE